MNNGDFYTVEVIPAFQIFVKKDNILKPYNTIYILDEGIKECSTQHLIPSHRKNNIEVSTYVLEMAYLPDHFIEDISFFGILDYILIKEYHKTFRQLSSEIIEEEVFYKIVFPTIKIEEFYNTSGDMKYKIIITGRKEVSNEKFQIESK